MKIVLFGATGNIGTRIAREAVTRGHDVVGVVRDPEHQQSPDSAVKLVKGDATDADSVASVARGADAIVSAISPRPNTRGLGAPRLADAARALLAGALAASNPAAMAAMKRAFWEGTEDWEMALAARARVSGLLVLSDYTRAAITRFRTR